MKLIFSEVEYEILARTAKGPIEQAALVHELSTGTAPNYCYMKLRSMAARGHITREKAGGRVRVSITPAGLRALAMMDSAEVGI